MLTNLTNKSQQALIFKLNYSKALKAAKVLSRPAPGRCCACHEWMHKFATGVGQTWSLQKVNALPCLLEL